MSDETNGCCGPCADLVAPEGPSEASPHAEPLPCAPAQPAETPTRRGVAAFLVLSFGLAWALWLPALAFQLSFRSGIGATMLFAGAFAPAAAAILVRVWITREGFDDAGLGLSARKWPYLLVAWLYPFALVAGVVLPAVLFGPGKPNLALAAAPQIPLFVLVAQAMVMAVVTTPILWGEEFGWRGYLQPRLVPGRPILSALATGLIWGAWHYPVNLNGYNFPQHVVQGLFVFPVSTALLSVLLGWLWDRTDSIWAPSLGHAALNTIAAGLLVGVFYPNSSTWILVNPLGLYSWMPLAVMAALVVWARRR